MVVIIIAILASIALPGYLRTAERSHAAEALTVLSAIRGAQQRYAAQNNNVFGAVAQQCQLDVDIPGSGCAPILPPASTFWTYNVNTAGNALATRAGAAPFGGLQIQVDLANGKNCGNNATAQQIYGVGAPGC